MKLIIKNLKKDFDKKEVLKNISFEFEEGKIKQEELTHVENKEIRELRLIMVLKS